MRERVDTLGSGKSTPARRKNPTFDEYPQKEEASTLRAGDDGVAALGGHDMARMNTWDGVERRCGDERRDGTDRRTDSRDMWDRRSKLDRRGHKLYAAATLGGDRHEVHGSLRVVRTG
ncbi:MAG TPA: hypothetical protein VF221_00415 [Chloroflexota bacterium]